MQAFAIVPLGSEPCIKRIAAILGQSLLPQKPDRKLQDITK